MVSQFKIYGDWSDSVVFSTDQGGKCFIVFKRPIQNSTFYFYRIIFCINNITCLCSNVNYLNANKWRYQYFNFELEDNSVELLQFLLYLFLIIYYTCEVFTCAGILFGLKTFSIVSILFNIFQIIRHLWTINIHQWFTNNYCQYKQQKSNNWHWKSHESCWFQHSRNFKNNKFYTEIQ